MKLRKVGESSGCWAITGRSWPSHRQWLTFRASDLNVYVAIHPYTFVYQRQPTVCTNIQSTYNVVVRFLRKFWPLPVNNSRMHARHAPCTLIGVWFFLISPLTGMQVVYRLWSIYVDTFKDHILAKPALPISYKWLMPLQMMILLKYLNMLSE